MNTVTHSTYYHYRNEFKGNHHLSLRLDDLIKEHKNKTFTDEEFLDLCSLMQGRYPFKPKGAE